MSQSRSEQTKNISGGRNLSLQARLVLFVLFISLVPLIIIATRDILQTQEALTNSAEISLKSSAAQTANSIDTFIQTTLDTVGAEAKFIDFTTYLTLSPSAPPIVQARAFDLLNALRDKSNPNIISYAIVDANGTVLLDTVGINIGNNESGESYFPQVRFNDKPIVTAVTYSDDKTTSISFASKIININGDYVGILRATYNSRILQDVITSSAGAVPDTSILLLDQLNIRMADNQNPDLVLQSIVPLELIDYLLAVDTKRFLDLPREEQATDYLDFELALDNAVTQPFFRAEITPKTPGDDTIAVAFMKTQPWVVTYSRPTAIFLADVESQTRTNIILVTFTSIIIAIVATLVARSFTNPIISLTKTANSISQGDLSARAQINNSDEIGTLASAFNSMTDQLQSTLVGLEERISERTADLQKSKLELETIADVAREIATIRDLDTLLNVSASLIRERLSYYHVGIFLIDERGEYAILRAASSVAADQLMESNYKLRVGQTGLVGNVTRTGKAYIALDVGTDAFHFENPLLPETRSEITLPLRSHSITIGALDIQANIPAAFNERDTQTLQILADQLAAAIENAQLVHQVEGTLRELTNANRLQSQETWHSAISERAHPAYEYDGLQVKAVPQNLPSDLLKQLENGKPVIVNTDAKKNTLIIPLMVFNQVIGVIGLEQEDANRTWTDEEIAVAQAAANRAALTLENARLLEESQRRAVKERTIFEATARIGSAVNIENILQATAEELERVLSGAEVILQFQTDNDPKAEK
ncbi:MAG: GAF domain-containing protein [Anaerolineales bacterium]|nr:GAF domain-containing protein [Anaerolineales bacterium]